MKRAGRAGWETRPAPSLFLHYLSYLLSRHIMPCFGIRTAIGQRIDTIAKQLIANNYIPVSISTASNLNAVTGITRAGIARDRVLVGVPWGSTKNVYPIASKGVVTAITSDTIEVRILEEYTV